MRRLALFACLLLIGSAAAQMPQPTLSIEDIRGPAQLMPYQADRIKIDLRFDCNLIEAGESRVVTLSTKASHPAIVVSGTSSRTIDTQPCMQSVQRYVEFDMELDLAVQDINTTSVESIEIHASATAAQPQTSPPPQDARAVYSLVLMEAPEEAAAEPALDVEPDDQLAPGPALPLLGLGALGLARLRRD